MYRIDNDEFVDRLRDIRDRDPRYRAERERTTRALAQWAIDRVLLHRMAEVAWVRKVHDNPLVAPHDVEHQQRQPASRLRRVADPYESLRVLPDVEVPEWTLDFTAPTAVE
jgi:hypothetical protein